MIQFNTLLITLLLLCGIATDGYTAPRKEKGRAKRVLFIGDSITDGNWGNSNGGAQPSEKRTHWDMNHIYGHGYMSLCASHYQSRYPERAYQFYNRGISGNTLQDLTSRWEKDVLALNPDVVTILIGTNDVHNVLQSGNQLDYAEWDKLYRNLLDRCLKNNPEIKFVLCAPFVAHTGKMKNNPNYQARAEMVAQCADVVRQIARDYKATFIPFDILFEKLYKETEVDSDTYWIWDGIHPTPAGHRRMADMWIKRVDKAGIL